MSTIDDLKGRARQIRLATHEGENTAERVGSLMEDTVDFMGNLPQTDSSAAIASIQAELNNKVNAATFENTVAHLEEEIAEADNFDPDNYYTKDDINGYFQIESTPIPGSDALITSGGVYNALNDVQDIVEGEFIGGEGKYGRIGNYRWAKTAPGTFVLNNGDSVTVSRIGGLTESQVVWTTHLLNPVAENFGYTYTAYSDNVEVLVGFENTEPPSFDYMIIHKAANAAIDRAINNNTVQFSKVQSLSTAQKQQARDNIDVYSKAEVDELIAAVIAQITNT